MRIFAKEELAEELSIEALDGYIGELTRQLPWAGAAYAIAPEAAAKTALAKFLAYILLKDSEVCIYLTGWNLQPNSEHLELLYAYRRAEGERRTLAEAPVHVFDLAEHDELVSLLCLTLFFQLEAWIFNLEGGTLMRLGQPAQLEVQTDRLEVRLFAEEPDKFLRPLTGTSNAAMRKSA